jgi:hypothetical protein
MATFTKRNGRWHVRVRRKADSLEPLARDTIKGVRADRRILRPDDPLMWWFFAGPRHGANRTRAHRGDHHLVGFTHGILFEVALERVRGFCSDHPSERRNQRLISLRGRPHRRSAQCMRFAKCTKRSCNSLDVSSNHDHTEIHGGS